MRWLMLLLTITTGTSLAGAVPNALNYQGQLFLNGSPTTGPVTIVFRMFDVPTGGTALWSETDNVTVNNGLFHSILGDGTAFPTNLFTAQVPWLEMEVNGNVLASRIQFQSVPYALNAPAAGGNELWESDGTNVWRETGKVGVGTSNPGHALDVQSSDANLGRYLKSGGADAGSYVLLTSNNSRGAITLGNPSPWGVEPPDVASLVQTTGGWQWTKQLNIMGQVGIGTNAPTSQLDVRGDVTIDNGGSPSIFTGASPSGQRYVALLNSPSSPSASGLKAGGVLVSDTYAYADPPPNNLVVKGSVGIGTANPTDKLHVISSGQVAAISGIDPSTNTNTFGIYGETNSSTNGISPGNPGAGSAVGLYGRAKASTSSGGATLAVLGRNDANTTTGDIAAGVFGWAPGVSGGAPAAFDGIVAGVIGESWSRNASGAGVIGFNESPTGNTRGVWGEVKSTTGRAIYGRNPSSSGYAGWFDGNLRVVGDFTLTAGTKMAVVPTSRGMTELYCQESPEVWFEDFGSGQLENGSAEMMLDPLFLETVTVSEAHPLKVFVQLEDECEGVYVRKTTTSFTVHELNGGSSSACFSYRVVAKRKGFEDLRLRTVQQAAHLETQCR